MKISEKDRAKAKIITSSLESLACGAVFTLLYTLPHGGLGFDTAARGYMLWSDGFTMSGVILLCLTGAFWLDRMGVWDWLLYALYQARYLLMRESPQSYANFHDYKKLRERSKKALWPWLLTAGLWICVGVILSLLYYRAL